MPDSMPVVMTGTITSNAPNANEPTMATGMDPIPPASMPTTIATTGSHVGSMNAATPVATSAPAPALLTMSPIRK